MRLLIAIDTWGLVGGTERYARVAAPLLRDAGHDVTILCAQALEPPPAGVELVLAPESAGETLTRDARRALRARLSTNSADVVFTLTARNRDVFTELLEHAPLVRYVQDHTLFCPGMNKLHEDGSPCTSPAGLACLQRYFLDTGCTGFKPAAFPRRLKNPLARLFARERDLAQHRRAEHLLVNSLYMRSELLQVGFAPERVSHLPYFTESNTSAEPPGELPAETRAFLASGQAPVIATPARLTLPDKGVDFLLTALGKLQHPWRAVIAGTGPAEEWLREKTHTEGLSDRVHFAGWLDAASMEALYAATRLVVFPSVWNEPFGLVGLEAMAHGLPVVAFEVGGVPEWLTDGETGLLAPRRDTDALARAIDRLLADPELCRRLGANGHDRAATHYSRPAHAARLEYVLTAAAKRAAPS